MKKKLSESAFVQSLLSLMVVVVFVLIGIGSIDFGGYLGLDTKYKGQETKKLANGDYQQTIEFSTFMTVITGKKDKYGKWEGPIKYEKYWSSSNELYLTEEYTMVNGRRNGTTTINYSSGKTVQVCYDMGYRVECNKSAFVISESSSAFNVMTDKYPVFYYNIEAFNFEAAFIEAFMDTIELLLYTCEFTESEFETYYQKALDQLTETVYDTLITVNSIFTYMEGQEILKNSEFRMAVIDSYRADKIDTYSTLQNTYPYYLNTMNSGGISYQDFETFCHDFDSILMTYEPLDKEDPFFTDSIDSRIGISLFTILAGEDSTKSAVLYLKSAPVIQKERSAMEIWQQLSPLLSEMKTDSVSQNVALVIVAFMFMEYDQADVVKKSVREAYYLKMNIATYPIVTTKFSENNSSTSVALTGYVIESGGAEVTSRGVAWAGFYNPSTNEQTINGGAGTGEFSVTLEGLIPGNTYYARAFATNSVETGYGNCISFTAGATGLENIKENDSDFIIYPNPASGLTTFCFRAEQSEIISLTIFDINGRALHQKEFENLPGGENLFQLDLSGWQNGIYYCRLSNNGTEKVTRKLMIVR